MPRSNSPAFIYFSCTLQVILCKNNSYSYRQGALNCCFCVHVSIYIPFLVLWKWLAEAGNLPSIMEPSTLVVRSIEGCIAIGCNNMVSCMLYVHGQPPLWLWRNLLNYSPPWHYIVCYGKRLSMSKGRSC